MNKLSNGILPDYNGVSYQQYYNESKCSIKGKIMKIHSVHAVVSLIRLKPKKLLTVMLFFTMIYFTITYGMTTTAFADLPYGKTYTNDIYEFQIQYPANPEFEIEEVDYDETDRVTDIVTFYSIMENHNDVFADNFGVSVDSVSYDVNLQNYLDETIDIYRESLDDFEILEQNTDSMLGGMPAYELVYSYTDHEMNPNGDPLSMKSYETGLIAEDQSIYFIQLFAKGSEYDKYYDLLKPYIDSFKLDENDFKNLIPSDFLTYSNLEHGIKSLSYPSNYEIVDYTEESSQLYSDEDSSTNFRYSISSSLRP